MQLRELEERKYLREIEERKQQVVMDIDFSPFDPASYQTTFFPFFEPNGDSYLTLLGRDDGVNKINDIVLPDPNNRGVLRQKYWPIIISSSRGMGKTFSIKMIALQKIKAELKNVLIEEAISLWSYTLF
jgi:hypothetical protein